MWRILLRCLSTLAFLFLILLITQVATWLYIIGTYDNPDSVDAIIVFEGGPNRVYTAYQLVDQGISQALVVSPASIGRLKYYDRQYKPVKPFQKIIEDRARTTFENAFYTSKIIRDNHFRTVVLVTSWDHMPRSYVFLKFALIGTGTQVFVEGIPTGRLTRENWYRYRIGRKMIYNEIVKNWGSLIEMIVCYANGGVPESSIRGNDCLKKIKRVMLFDIGHDAIIGAYSEIFAGINIGGHACIDEGCMNYYRINQFFEALS